MCLFFIFSPHPSNQSKVYNSVRSFLFSSAALVLYDDADSEIGITQWGGLMQQSDGGQKKSLIRLPRKEDDSESAESPDDFPLSRVRFC
ncbi:hypothetical protein CEXT_606041 [Caerostris extrusa]|uniref:Uncharacterized protein n=1 Tax=Caerostris extrusa TaxID=172846 RepID=A0AAV4Q0N4_CAEEX|nr:hypothetical protein CEXT_606041 [Caerostris extrusa]